VSSAVASAIAANGYAELRRRKLGLVAALMVVAAVIVALV
jgi:hypothetical protein